MATGWSHYNVKDLNQGNGGTVRAIGNLLYLSAWDRQFYPIVFLLAAPFHATTKRFVAALYL